MAAKKGIALVIPTFNEEIGLRSILPDISGTELLLVDGGSTDNTLKVAAEHSAKLIVEKTPGYGRAYKTGIASTKSELIAGMDADGTYSPKDVLRAAELLEKEGADAVFGDRLSPQGNTMRPHRKIANIAMTSFLNLLFFTHLRDSQSGLWVLRRDAYLDCIPKSDGMPFSQELKIRIEKRGKKIAWIPITYQDREKGSKFSFFQDGAKLLASVLELRFRVKK